MGINILFSRSELRKLNVYIIKEPNTALLLFFYYIKIFFIAILILI